MNKNQWIILFSEKLRLNNNNGSALQYYADNQWNYICGNDTVDSTALGTYICKQMHLPT